MHLSPVNVTGTLVLPSGKHAALATIRFTMSSPGLLGVTVVLPRSVRAVADEDGNFSASLLPSSQHTYYTVTVFRSNGVVLLETVAVIPAYDCQFSQVIQARPATTVTASIAALAQLQAAQENIETARLQILATADATNAGSQTALIELQAAVSTYEILIANTQSTIVGLVDTAVGTSIDLVTAYQLST